MQNMPGENSLILVGILPSPKDLEIAKLLGWYRIPFRMAPKIIDVDYLAFFQTGAFGVEHRWKIEYFAEVKGHELTTRRELLRNEVNHPRANEEYFKIEIGSLTALPNSISAKKWKRITFLYTIGSLFNHATFVDDLVVRTEEREILWKSMRERIENSNCFQKTGDGTSNFSDNEIMQFLSSFSDSNLGDDAIADL